MTLSIFDSCTTLAHCAHCQRVKDIKMHVLAATTVTTGHAGNIQSVCHELYLSPPNWVYFGFGKQREKKGGLWVKCEEKSKRKIKLPHVWLSVHHLAWKKKKKRGDLVNLMLCNFLPSEHMLWEGRGSHPSWATVAECHSSSQIVVYNRGESSVSHITPLEVTLSCRPRQHDSDRGSSARSMYSKAILDQACFIVLLLSLHCFSVNSGKLR